MKRLMRIVPVLLVAMLALVPVLPAFAQGGSNPLCNGLSDADCQILETANAAVGTVTSFAAPSWEIRFNFTDGTQQVAVSAKGSGAFSFADGQVLAHLVIDSASFEAPDSPSQAISDMEIIVTNDMAYVNFNGEWYGEAITPEDLQSAGLGDISSLGDISGMMGMSGDSAMAGIDLTGVVTTTRGADGDSMGQKTAEFSSNLDIAKLLTAVLSSPMMGEALSSGAGADLGLGDMTAEDMQMMSAFIAPLLAETTITLNLSVGLDDTYFHKIELASDINIDVTMFSPETGKITGEIYFMTELAEHNQPLSVTAPDSYKPMEELQGQLDALGLSM